MPDAAVETLATSAVTKTGDLQFSSLYCMETPTMPNWSTDIPKDPRGVALPLRRTPTSSALIAVVTSEDLLGCDTHFYGGHTVPCSAPDCKACRDGLPFRWHAYFAAQDQKTRLHFIFECTAQAAEPFKQHRDAHRTLRGCLFEAKRWHSRPNGRVIIRTRQADLTNLSLPIAPDVRKCMAIVWQLPNDAAEIAGQIKDAPRLRVNQDAAG